MIGDYGRAVWANPTVCRVLVSRMGPSHFEFVILLFLTWHLVYFQASCVPFDSACREKGGVGYGC